MLFSVTPQQVFQLPALDVVEGRIQSLAKTGNTRRRLPTHLVDYQHTRLRQMEGSARPRRKVVCLSAGPVGRYEDCGPLKTGSQFRLRWNHWTFRALRINVRYRTQPIGNPIWELTKFTIKVGGSRCCAASRVGRPWFITQARFFTPLPMDRIAAPSWKKSKCSKRRSQVHEGFSASCPGKTPAEPRGGA